ncbi:MAG: zf-HC2 domain-containing protein [Steroidobacteraceae bacterium]
MQCPESLRVQAYFDAEVDAVSAADIERHLEHCAECRALLKDLEQVRAVLRRDSEYARATPALRAGIMRALDREYTSEDSAVQIPPTTQAPPSTRAAPATEAASVGEVVRPRERLSRRQPRSFWMGALGGAGGAAIAATFAFMLLVPRFTNPLLDELVSAHVRSLMPPHLIDVVSTDKHTVKPWFAGHTDVSPVVADFEPQGYKLIGGRADYLDHQRSAVVVYQHGAHVINVFSWAGNQRALPDNATRSGYHLAFWREGDLDYCAVSDTGWDELLGLVRLLRRE